MSAKGRRREGYEPSALDYYPTPPGPTRLILPHILGSTSFSGTVIEPACGDGAILEVVREYAPAARLLGIEMHPGRAELARSKGFTVTTRNALSEEPWHHEPGFTICLTNVPFGIALNFLRRGLIECDVVCSLLRINFLGSQDRAAWLEANPPDVYTLCKRPYSDATEYGWFAWHRDEKRTHGRLFFLREPEFDSGQLALDGTNG